MVASNAHCRSNRFPGWIPRALRLALIALLSCVWPTTVWAGDAATDPAAVPAAFDPFDLPREVTFEPFEDAQSAVQQVAASAPVAAQPPQSIKPHPPVDMHDPFEEVAWAVPLKDSDYALPAASAAAAPAAVPEPARAPAPPREPRTQTAEFTFTPSTDVVFTQTTQIELLEPGDQDQAEGYAESARDWTPKPLDQLTINIAEPTGLTPHDYAGDRPPQRWPCDPTASRCWPMLTYQWAATCLCYQPLYFEEINAERYGYGCGKCLQPAASAAHFFGTVPILPYCMAVNCPGECNYTLGEYRPGSCAPWRTQCAGPSCRGGWAEAGTVVGLVLLIP